MILTEGTLAALLLLEPDTHGSSVCAIQPLLGRFPRFYQAGDTNMEPVQGKWQEILVE